MFQSTPYLIPLLITTILSLVVAFVVWQRRQAPGAVPLAVLASAVALWALAYLVSLASTTLAAQLFWANVAFLGIVLAPVSWLIFAVIYSGQGDRLSLRRLLLLLVMPLATLVAVWTNELHGMFRSAVFLVDTGSFVVLEVMFGPLFWVHTAYSYLLLLAGTFLLLRNLFRMSPAYRRQAGGLIIGVAAPWVSNALYLSGRSPFPYLDLTPFALSISGIALTWDLLRSGLFDLAPIAYNTVFHSMEDGVIVLDAQDRIVEINSAAMALVSRQSHEVIGQPAAKVFAEQEAVVERYRQVSEAHDELVFDAEGNMRAFDLRISPIADRNRRLNGRVIVLRDITERRRAAAELRRQNEELIELARKNAQLYAAVQQELAERKQTEVALSLAKEAAEIASRAKSRFLGNMSHELRTPLTAILGYADLLEADIRQQGYQELASDIERIQIAGRHLLNLISDVLDLTRIEAEKLDLHLEYFDLASLVQDVVNTIMPLVTKNNNTLQVECSPDSGLMYADNVRVRQVLLNVLANAAKFTESGQIRLQVTVGAATLDRVDLLERNQAPMVLFAISDTGIGMSIDQQQQLFKEFVQVDDSSTRKYGGTGLGLAISYRLCRLMGGDISAESTIGQGSTFTVELPVQVVLPAHSS